MVTADYPVYYLFYMVMRYLPVAILLMLISLQVGAQCPNYIRQLDIAASYGSISPDQINLGVNVDNKTISYISGAQFVSVRYFLYAYLSMGFTGGIVMERGQYADDRNHAIVKSTYTKQAMTIAPELYYVYLYRKYFEAYTLLGAGVASSRVTTTTNATIYTPASTATTSESRIKMQYTPIGIRVGGHLSAFAELGFGYKGVFNAGVSFRFGHPVWWKQ
ncbi:MAG: hypothetical protein JWQ38_39 [Flavipsychrobacter sp.]|nr:hypothetical protein [Flavipsychrobacter sp.]